MTEKSFSSDETDFSRIKENYKIITENLSNAMLKAGRKDKVLLMAVTKTVPTEKVNYAASLGINLLGENRVQEFLSKYENYSEKCEIHFIGGLQNNKIKYIIDKVKMIHSVDSQKLAEEINKRAADAGLVMDILIEVNIGAELSKSGIPPEQADEMVAFCKELPNLRLRGFMAIPPPDENGSVIKHFEQMNKIYSDSRSKYGGEINVLSMGMSGDYEKAVLCGSTMVRIGSALFGKRKQLF